MIRALLFAACFLSATCVEAEGVVEKIDTVSFGAAELAVPHGVPSGAVAVLSDASGWSEEDEQMLTRIAADGALAIGIDVGKYLSNVNAGRSTKRPGDCLDVFQDIEDASRLAQARHPSPFYNLPYVIGVGEGGSLTNVAVEQAPAATLAGGVSLDPWMAIQASMPLCRGASPAGGAEPSRLPEASAFVPKFWAAVFDDAAPSEPLARAEDLEKAGVRVERASGVKSRGTALGLLENQLRSLASAGVAALPLVALPADGGARLTAIVLSGDGGWRDLDKTIGENLQKAGIPVVGWDSLRYFWNRKSPAQTARDFMETMTAYSEKWRTTHFALIGYSFGADVLPTIYNRLPPHLRDEVTMVSLLGLESSADWEIHMSGWFGAGPSPEATPVMPDLAHIPSRMIQCFYGADEKDSACPSLQDRGVELIRTTGGHHFDGDYAALTRRIIDGLKRRGGL